MLLIMSVIVFCWESMIYCISHVLIKLLMILCYMHLTKFTSHSINDSINLITGGTCRIAGQKTCSSWMFLATETLTSKAHAANFAWNNGAKFPMNLTLPWRIAIWRLFIYQIWWSSIAMLNSQRVTIFNILLFIHPSILGHSGATRAPLLCAVRLYPPWSSPSRLVVWTKIFWCWSSYSEIPQATACPVGKTVSCWSFC